MFQSRHHEVCVSNAAQRSVTATERKCTLRTISCRKIATVGFCIVPPSHLNMRLPSLPPLGTSTVIRRLWRHSLGTWPTTRPTRITAFSYSVCARSSSSSPTCGRSRSGSVLGASVLVHVWSSTNPIWLYTVQYPRENSRSQVLRVKDLHSASCKSSWCMHDCRDELDPILVCLSTTQARGEVCCEDRVLTTQDLPPAPSIFMPNKTRGQESRALNMARPAAIQPGGGRGISINFQLSPTPSQLEDTNS